MLKPTGQSQMPTEPFTTGQFVRGAKKLVESYRSFRSSDLGINTPIDVLAPLGTNPDPYLEAKTAILCENFIRRTMKLEETSRADLPKWIKTGLALISASHADDLTDKIISEQPLQNKSGRIHYLDIKTERTKGALPSGQRIFDALRGYYGGDDVSNEEIKGEPVGAAGGTTFAVNVEYLPAIPDSIEFTDGTQVVRDDRNGNLIGDVGAPAPGFTNTINYLTGEASFVFAAASSAPVVANYAYNIEAATELPKYGISLRSVTVEARPRAIATSWSQQSVFDLLNDWGIDAEPTIMDAGAKIIMAEKFKHVVRHLYTVAKGGTLVFDNTNPAAITYQEHIDSFGILLTRLQNEIWQNTQRVRPNVMVHSPDIWFLLQYTKGFQGQGAAGASDALAGPKVSGTLSNHNMFCICDPTMKPGSAVVTYKGNEMVNTAAMVGMYIPLYKAPVHQKGFHKDTALLTEYVIHVINPEMMGRIQVINL